MVESTTTKTTSDSQVKKAPALGSSSEKSAAITIDTSAPEEESKDPKPQP